MKKNTATRINCGKGSHSTSTTTYILETIYSTSGNDSRHGNNVGALIGAAETSFFFCGDAGAASTLAPIEYGNHNISFFLVSNTNKHPSSPTENRYQSSYLIIVNFNKSKNEIIARIT